MQIIFLGHLYKVDLSLRVVTISWLIIGCGPEYMVPGYGSYGSETCGRLSVPVDIYIDGCVHAFHFVRQFTYSYFDVVFKVAGSFRIL